MSHNTAEKILLSMYELMATVGYEKASINMICKNVGVTKSSFYHFFDSKEQVLIEIVRQYYITDFSSEIEQIRQVTDPEQYKQLLLSMCYELIDGYETNDELRKIFAETSLQAVRIPEIREIVDSSNQDMLNSLKEYLHHGLSIKAFKEGFNVTENAEILCAVFLGLDSAILNNIAINAKSVVTNVIERMFL